MLFYLAEMYAKSKVFIRQCIHQLAPELIRTIGADSSSLLNLIKTCPRGSEGFVLFVLHTLSENQAPHLNIINAAKTLYKSRPHQDARFLIPVLIGLRKDEILELLPKIVCLPSKNIKAALTK